MSVHRDCKPGQCQYAGFDVDGEVTIELPSGTELTYRGCPINHVDDAEATKWIGLYRWLARWKKTPVEMGLCTVERLDPRYFDFMDLIDAAMPKPKKPEGGR